MAAPTHFYQNTQGYLRFVTLVERRKNQFATSDGVWASTVDVKPVSELYGSLVELDGVFGTLKFALTDESRLEQGKTVDMNNQMFLRDLLKLNLNKFPLTEEQKNNQACGPQFFTLDRQPLTYMNELVYVYWHQGQKHRHPSWVNVNKLKFV